MIELEMRTIDDSADSLSTYLSVAPLRYDPASICGDVAKHSSHILELAAKGAEVQYQELKTEIAAGERFS
jgi:hypothetical protein